MKRIYVLLTITTLCIKPFYSTSQTSSDNIVVNDPEKKKLYIDVHHLGSGGVKYKDVAKAHAKDLAVEGKYGVHFTRYWVNEEKGLVYCLSSANDTESVIKAHAEGDGFFPDHICEVSGGPEANVKDPKNLFLDIHHLGAGKVTAQDVAAAHNKDLAAQQKHGVSFINYWVDVKEGVVMCLSEAKDSASIIQTHKEAHGLIPDQVLKVQQGK